MNDIRVKVIRFDDEDKDNALMHFGIKDMHWGVRRYQNPDGSLTSLGREHYGVDEAKKMPEKKYDEVLDFLVNYESAVYDLYEQDFWDEDKPFE